MPDIPKLLQRNVMRLRAYLEAAGITYIGMPSGHVLDVDAVRYSMATMLAKAGVALQVIQQIMRLGLIDLTMNTYTDTSQLADHKAIKNMPGASGQTEETA